MKKCLLSIITFFIPVLSFSQNSFFEISDAPQFNCGIDKIINDGNGYFYSVSSSKSLWTGAGFVYKTDVNGNEVFRKQFQVYDITYLEDIALTSDSNLIICGFTQGCDWMPSRLGLIIKMNRQGDTLWMRQVNPDTQLNSFDNHLHKILSLDDGSILTTADSTVYKTDSAGNITWEVPLNGSIRDIGYAKNDLNFISTSSGLFIIDSSGNILNNIPAYANAMYPSLLSDSTYLFAIAASLVKTDTSFMTISTYSPSAINFSVSALSISHDTIWITNNSGSDFASFDLNLNLLDTFRTQASQVNVTSFSVFDSMIVVAGLELAERNYIYIKSYSINKNYKYYANDLALIGVSFDTSFAVPYIPFPVITVVSFLPVLTVQNNGQDTIHGFYASALSVNTGVCGPFEYHRFVNANLAPGQIQSFALDTLREVLPVGIGSTYHFCPWISCPDLKVDKDHSNDFLCDSFVITEIVPVETIEENNTVVIYPNPTSSIFTISRSQGSGNAWMEIFNVVGERIHSAILTLKNETINANLSPGIYFIQINDGKKQYVQKLMIE